MTNQLPSTLFIGNSDRRLLLLEQLAKLAYRFGYFTLSSGAISNHYVNCKPVSLSGSGLALISSLMLEQVEPDSIAVAGLTLGADPIVTGVSQAAFLRGRKLNALIVRKEPKGHGSCSWIEGPLPIPGSKITLLEDVVTTGNSTLKAVKQLREAGYCVQRVVTLVDRQENGKGSIKAAGLNLVSLFLLEEIISKAQEIINSEPD